jgi:DNA-directed RNA polymerase specialized sigma subunit
MVYDKLILNSHNKIKTNWDIINKETGRNTKKFEINTMKIDGKKLNDQQQAIAKEFNKYFVNIADKIKRQDTDNPIVTNDINNDKNHIYLMNQAFTNPYPKMNCKCSTNKEIEQIIKSLKLKNLCGYDEISPMI